jgi:predicted site-specific integrase-resolvase
MKKRIEVGGATYVHCSIFADEIGVTVPTVYQWKSEGRLDTFAIRYCGKLYLKEKAIEPFKKALLQPV